MDDTNRATFDVVMEVTYDDYLAASAAIFAMRRTRFRVVENVLLWGFVSGVFAWAYTLSDTGSRALPIVFFGVLVGFFLGAVYQLLWQPVFLPWIVRRNVATLRKQGPIPLVGRQHVKVDADGITNTLELTSVHLKWGCLNGRAIDAERFFLFSGGSTFVVLPWRDLSGFERNELATVLNQRLPRVPEIHI